MTDATGQAYNIEGLCVGCGRNDEKKKFYLCVTSGKISIPTGHGQHRGNRVQAEGSDSWKKEKYDMIYPSILQLYNRIRDFIICSVSGRAQVGIYAYTQPATAYPCGMLAERQFNKLSPSIL